MIVRYVFFPGWAVAPEYYRCLNFLDGEWPEVTDYGFFTAAATFEPRHIPACADAAEPVVILAHSMGTMFALRAAATRTHIKALVLFSPFARFSEAEGYGGQPLRILKAMRMQLRRDPKALLENFYSAMSNPEVIGFEPGASINVAALDNGLECLMEYDVRELLPEIKCPVLLIQGGMDNISAHGQAAYLAERLPSGHRKTITDAGPALPFTRMDECRNTVQSFLRQYIG